MHPPEVKQAALDLIAAGHNDCEVSRRLGLARTTIRDWRHPRYTPRNSATSGTCLRCWRTTTVMRFESADYAELLGMYLGDGCISEHPRTQRLRITLDRRYPGVISDGLELLERCFPYNRVLCVERRGEKCSDLSVYSRHLTCVFPQHAGGKKHDREISLEPWQAAAVRTAPWSFIRGAIRTDGCVFVNRTGPYEYVSYHFGNRSEDIARLVARSCEDVGVRFRLTHNPKRRLWEIRINRRESVALMLKHVGRKS